MNIFNKEVTWRKEYSGSGFSGYSGFCPERRSSVLAPAEVGVAE